MKNNIRKEIIGIDIGGTNTKGVLWDGKRSVRSSKVSTPDNAADFVAALNNMVEKLGREHPVAVGVAGVVEKNKVVESPNIPYLNHFYFSAESGLRFAVKKLDNDARCFARAEYFLGDCGGAGSAFFITLGTGVGRAMAKDGKVLAVKKFEYPEPWEKEYQRIRDSKNLEGLAEFLGKKISDLANPYRPRVIIVGGGVAKRRGFFGLLKKHLDVPLKRTAHKKNSSAIGAAMMLVKNEN